MGLDAGVSQNREQERPQAPPSVLNSYDILKAPAPAERLDGAPGFRSAANDSTRPDKPGALTPDQVADVAKWHSLEPRILDYNIRTETDGGAHLQNSIFAYTRNVLKQEGLDKAGWEVFPVASQSPLDKIGADIVLLNVKTGAMAFMDPTSRRLDPVTGEPAQREDVAKTNVPPIREPGVVDALPKWFGRGMGTLNIDSEDLQMQASIKNFKDTFPDLVHHLVENPPFNIKDFPLPSYSPVKDQKMAVDQIQAVVDWAAKSAAEARRSGDMQSAYLRQDFGKTLTSGALNFSKRTESTGLHGEMERSVNQVIAEEAFRRAYPSLAKDAPVSQRSVRLSDGSEIKADRANILVFNMRATDKSGTEAVATAGSLTDSFQKATSYWAGAQGSAERRAEFVGYLPGSVKKLIEAGKVDLAKLIAEIGHDRNVFAGGGAGIDKPLIGRVVARLGRREAEIRGIVNGAPENTSRAAATHEVTSRPASVGEVPKEVPKTATQPPHAHEASRYGRPVSQARSASEGGEGVRWQAGQAPKPQIGRVDRADKPAEVSDHLTPAEVSFIERARQAIENKGADHLNEGDKEQIRSFLFAESELAKPLGGDRTKIEIVGQIRRLMGETRGAVMSLAVLSTAVLSFYQANRAQADDSHRAKFY
jgi:hypothetical protein